MKTAISVPDEIFRQATRFAKKLGVSRSELFTRAMERFLSDHERGEIRASYDRAFGPDAGDDDSEDFRNAATRNTSREAEW